MNFLVHLGPVNGDFAGRVDPEADLISVDGDDYDSNIVSDDDGLIRFSRENEHRSPYTA